MPSRFTGTAARNTDRIVALYGRGHTANSYCYGPSERIGIRIRIGILNNIPLAIYQICVSLVIRFYRCNDVIALTIFKLGISVLVYSHLADYISGTTNN